MDGLDGILGIIGGTARHLAGGDFLFRRGAAATALFRLERGAIRLCWKDGSHHPVAAGGILGESALFEGHHGCDAVATAPALVQVYAKARVLLAIRAHPDLGLAFLAALAGQMNSLRRTNGILRLPAARERVLAWLALQGADGREITLDRPLMAVADEIGLTHEALYRTLAALVAEGRLERRGKRIFRLR